MNYKFLLKLTSIFSILLGAFLIYAGQGRVLARGGCFLGDTQILTKDGYKEIKDITPGTELLSYSFETKQKEVSKVEKVDVLKVEGYFILNNEIKVTGSHPFYVFKWNDWHIVEAKNINIGDKLLDKNGEAAEVFSKIEKQEEVVVYNLVNVEPNNNYFASGILVHNKGGRGGGGGSRGGGSFGGFTSSRYRSSSSTNYSCSYIVDPVAKKNCENNRKWMIIGSIVAPVVVTAFFVGIGHLAQRHTKNALKTKKSGAFSYDKKLIKYVRSLVPNFTNTFSPNHTFDTSIWTLAPEPDEISKTDYMHFISKPDLFEKIKELFARYQADWSRKNFSGMSSYVKEPFLSEQQGIFESNFGNNFDIVYEPEVLSITLIEANVDGETIHFKAQINAKMINFEVDETGGVFSGEPTHRSFSEDWSFTYETSSRNLYLTNIEQL